VVNIPTGPGSDRSAPLTGVAPVPTKLFRPQNCGAVIQTLPAVSSSEDNLRFLLPSQSVLRLEALVNHPALTALAIAN